jgi:hypothetical protein
VRHLATRGEDADGDREVEARSLLAHVRGREVDRDPLLRKLQARVQQGGADALARLADRPVGKPDQRERGQAAPDVHLDGDLLARHAFERKGGDG